MRIICICIVLFLGFSGFMPGGGKAIAQVPEKKEPKTQPDSVTQKNEQPADTIKKTSDERIIEGLKEYSKKRSLPAKAVKALFNFERREQVLGRDAELLNQQYAAHNYKVVRSIDYLILNAFGYSVQDTARKPNNIVKKAGNALHIKTGRGQIRNRLLFKVGEPLEPFALSESERLLRQTGFIYDARIIINEETTSADSVDIIVITRDIFSLGGSGSYSPGSKRGRVMVRDLNFLGQGHNFNHQYRFGNNLPQTWEYAGYYTVGNISNTYLTATLAYENRYLFERKGFSIGRGFYATNTKYAGTLNANWFNHKTYIAESDTSGRFEDLNIEAQDVWLGRSFALKSYDLNFNHRGRIITSGRIINVNHSKRPNRAYNNNQLYLATVGYALRKYYKDNYLFGFGRTEDIPAGNLFALTGGYQFFEQDTLNRSYFGAQTSFGKYKQNFGYLYMDLSFGSFHKNGSWSQGVFKNEILYFTRLYEIGNWKWRQFIWSRLTYGINRDPWEWLTIRNEQGLRGFSSLEAGGDKRFVLNYETNLFAPVSFVGIRLAGIVFADIGWVGQHGKNLFSETPYQGYGIGFRFRNEYMSFGTIQILLSYYPKVPAGDDINNFKVLNSSRLFYNFTDINLSAPGLIDFR